MSAAEKIEGGWRDGFLWMASACGHDTTHMTDPAGMPAKGPKPTSLFERFSASWNEEITKAPDGACRVMKMVELIFRDLADIGIASEPLINAGDLFKTICDVQQPAYRFFFGFELLTNPKHGSDHWSIFKVTGVICPVVLISVSGLQILCNAHKFNIITLSNHQWWSKIAQRAGMTGAGVAMFFSFQMSTFCFVRKNQVVLQADKDKLGAMGWNNAIAGTKYFFDGLKLFVGMYANNRGIRGLKYAAQPRAIRQICQKHRHWRSGLERYKTSPTKISVACIIYENHTINSRMRSIITQWENYLS